MYVSVWWAWYEVCVLMWCIMYIDSIDFYLLSNSFLCCSSSISKWSALLSAAWERERKREVSYAFIFACPLFVTMCCSIIICCYASIVCCHASIQFCYASIVCCYASIQCWNAYIACVFFCTSCCVLRVLRFSSFFASACLTRLCTSASSLSFPLCSLSSSSFCFACSSLTSNFICLFSSSTDISLRAEGERERDGGEWDIKYGSVLVSCLSANSCLTTSANWSRSRVSLVAISLISATSSSFSRRCERSFTTSPSKSDNWPWKERKGERENRYKENETEWEKSKGVESCDGMFSLIYLFFHYFHCVEFL